MKSCFLIFARITYKALLYNFQFLGISPQTNNNKNVVE